MTDSVQRPPKGKPWIWLTRELLESHAWRSLSVNARRVIDFLLIENMSHAGRQNGRLLAPRRQLEQAGIAARLVSKAIKEAERLGLIDVERGKGRRPSLYTLNWLQLPDGTQPEPRWRSTGSVAASHRKHQGYPEGSHKDPSDFRKEVTNPNSKCIQREAPLKKALTKAEVTTQM